MQLERHPLSKFWPDIPESRFAELKADIDKHGQRYPIIVYGSQVLDGWHRYRACAELKIKPKTEKFSGTAKGAADLVNSLNAQRRHVSESQRAFAITGCVQWAEGQTRGVARATPVSETDDRSMTNEEMSVIAGTSPDTIIRAKKVHRSGSSALKEAVQSGDLSVKRAAAVVDLPKSEQLAAAKKKPEPELPPEKWEPDADEEAMAEQFEREHAASLDKILAADDRLAAAHAEIKRQAAEIAALKLSRDGYMNGRSEMLRHLKKAQNKILRLEKELEQLRRERAA